MHIWWRFHHVKNQCRTIHTVHLIVSSYLVNGRLYPVTKFMKMSALTIRSMGSLDNGSAFCPVVNQKSCRGVILMLVLFRLLCFYAHAFQTAWWRLLACWLQIVPVAHHMFVQICWYGLYKQQTYKQKRIPDSYNTPTYKYYYICICSHLIYTFMCIYNTYKHNTWAIPH